MISILRKRKEIKEKKIKERSILDLELNKQTTKCLQFFAGRFNQ